ncbi:hypothetical protein FHX74_002961, partial [Friedmanniella endophytica]
PLVPRDLFGLPEPTEPLGEAAAEATPIPLGAGPAGDRAADDHHEQDRPDGDRPEQEQTGGAREVTGPVLVTDDEPARGRVR